MRKLFFFLLFLTTSWVLEAKEKDRPKICLNMIVKNETKVIRRCLDSVKPLIDYWVIVDTGSTDGTQKMIKEHMKGIPGELHERPWVNFAHNRNEALALAKKKGDYLLFIDADDVFAYNLDFVKPKLDKDSYYIKIKYSGSTYDRTQLIKSSLNWKWVGVVHEVLVSDEARSSDTLDGVTMLIIGGGDRSHDPKKFQKDAQLLENALKDDPNNARNVFYLAQSYRDADMYDLAIKNYEKRASMGGWDEEVYWSLYQIALLQELSGMPEEIVSKAYNKAFTFRPTRIEALYRLCSYYRKNEKYLLGYLLANFGLNIIPSSDKLFVETWIDEQQALLLEFSICAYWIGRYEESYHACNQLLSNKKLPAYVRACVEKNLAFATEKLSLIDPLILLKKAS